MDPVTAPGVGSKATLFVTGIVVLCLASAGFVLGITIVRPAADNMPLVTAVLGFIGPVIVALLAGAVQQVHLLVNSRLTQLLELTATANLAKGQLAGTAAAGRLAAEASSATNARVDQVQAAMEARADQVQGNIDARADLVAGRLLP